MDEESRTATGLLDGMPAHIELTDERLVVRIGSEAVPRYEVAFHQITAVEGLAGLMTGYLTIHMGDDRLVFSRIAKADVLPMADALRTLVAHAEPAPDEPPVDGHPPSPLDELERIGRLRDSGILTPDEFDEAKRKLLDRL
ncbi:SHOCT domain-containing protein [Nocardioides sp. URHA0020]|uniref:SHOCT domain-containing protein n=1 Tax=Nocardioides sp. URHA0020 TaxID=1380392 RepID=UPI000564969A|nr:SHOCT domain-containing protein [Nocardioides sp. URHA0020]